jgi:signal transduction histidine kinase
MIMKSDGIISKVTGSIFIRLIIIMAGAGIILNLVIGGTFRSFVREKSGRIIEKNISHHTDYIIKDIGTPPDFKKAKEISRKLAFQIAVRGPGVEWSTTGEVPDPANYRALHFHFEGKVMKERRGSRFAYVKEANGYRFIFFTDEKLHHRGWERFLAVFIISIFLVFFIAYLLIRKVLKPVKDLRAGVVEISEGNLGHRVPVRGNNELARLVSLFNAMNEKIGSMIRSRDQLLLDVSHELRTPLTRMKVALEFVKDENARRNIGDDIRELERMINEILETERLKHWEKSKESKEFGLFGLVREVRKDLGIDEGDISITGSDAKVKCGREKVKIVIKNIIENGTKYSDISATPLEVFTGIGEKQISLHFKDHGEGIPGEELNLVFEPFYRVDRSRSRDSGGYGLGLSLSKKIMEACGGDIAISSTPGEGTTITLVFPKGE